MARYFLRFRHSDTGLTPAFTFFKRASDLVDVAPQPPITELPPGYGTYYFDYTPLIDIVFEADGGASIPTEEVRYIADTISPKDVFVDEPTSQVHDDVWNDTDNRAPGTKGDFVEQIGVPADTSATASLFGKALLYKEAVRGDTPGNSDGKSVLQIDTKIGTPLIGGSPTVSGDIADVKAAVLSGSAPTASQNAIAVWDELLAGHAASGAAGRIIQDAFRILKNRTKINVITNQLLVYDDAGTTEIFAFDLKDDTAAPNAKKPYERDPVP